jgi:hypothetical protein
MSATQSTEGEGGEKPVTWEVETCRNCGGPGPLKTGWTNARYCSSRCERSAVSRLHGEMPGAGGVPYHGWVPTHIAREIANRWES